MMYGSAFYVVFLMFLSVRIVWLHPYLLLPSY